MIKFDKKILVNSILDKLRDEIDDFEFNISYEGIRFDDKILTRVSFYAVGRYLRFDCLVIEIDRNLNFSVLRRDVDMSGMDSKMINCFGCDLNDPGSIDEIICFFKSKSNRIF